jgi:hypothetical protein
MDYLLSYKHSESPQPQRLGIRAEHCTSRPLCGRGTITSAKRYLVHYIEFLGVFGHIDLCNCRLSDIQIFQQIETKFVEIGLDECNFRVIYCNVTVLVRQEQLRLRWR